LRALSFGFNSQGREAFCDGLGLENHAFAAPERTVVDGAMTVVGEGAQIVDGNLDEAFGESAAQDSIFEKAREEAGKDGDNLKPHRSYCR
jgi:hypothetical protein